MYHKDSTGNDMPINKQYLMMNAGRVFHMHNDVCPGNYYVVLSIVIIKIFTHKIFGYGKSKYNRAEYISGSC